MKKLLVLLLPVMAMGQKNKPIVYGEVFLRNDSLFQYVDNTPVFKGRVLPAIKFDANHNLLLGARDNLVTNSFENVLTGNNSSVRKAHGVMNLATDTDVDSSGNYSSWFGDGHDGAGYSSVTGGVTNENWVDGGINFGFFNTLGTRAMTNRYRNSGVLGSLIDVQASDVWVLGKGTRSTISTPGTYLIHGTNKVGVLPNGTILINGVPYLFPSAAPNVGDVLMCVAPGVLAWQQLGVTISSSFNNNK